MDMSRGAAMSFGTVRETTNRRENKMNRTIIKGSLASVAILMSACGSPASNAPTTTAAPTMSVAPGQTITSTPGVVPYFGDGTYLVGSSIAPGIYLSQGGPNCYWGRVGIDSNGKSVVLAMGIPTGPVMVTILSTDGGFITSEIGRASCRERVYGRV